MHKTCLAHSVSIRRDPSRSILL